MNTKTIHSTTRFIQNPGNTPPDMVCDTTETDAISSVELSENSKGEVRVSSYKVYSADPLEAERLALQGMMRLRAQISEAADRSLTAQLDASLRRKP